MVIFYTVEIAETNYNINIDTYFSIGCNLYLSIHSQWYYITAISNY